MQGKSALIVDDSKSARFALRRYLEGLQYQVDAVESADEALRYLDSSRPGVIFLDHVMPGVDGFTVLKTIKDKAETATIPVVMCSSNEGPLFNQRARNSGAHGVLQKPPDPEVLGRILADLEGGARAANGEVAAPATATTPVLSLVARGEPEVARKPAPAAAPVASADATRDQLESRMRKVSQGLFVQFAEIKATVAHLSSQQTRLAEQPVALRGEMRKRLEETSEALSLVTSRIENVEREVYAQLTEIRNHVERSLQAQTEEARRLADNARQIAADEAKAVAERTVMSAAMRISDQLADAILGAVGRRS